MKIKNFELAIILAFLAFSAFFASCGYDLIEIKDLIKKEPQPTDSTDIPNDYALPELEKYIETNPSLETNHTLSIALENLAFEPAAFQVVAIKAFTCINRGQSLLVYNPLNPDLDYFGSREYGVYWFKNYGPVKGTNRLECVCTGQYAVVVINRITGKSVGFATYSAQACYNDEILETKKVTD